MIPAKVQPIRPAKPRPASDAELGVAWWNAMSKQARLAALMAVESEGRASPAEAWEHWRQNSAGAGTPALSSRGN
jgi:hypothetical protein